MHKVVINLIHLIILIKNKNYCMFGLVHKETDKYIYCDILRRDNYYNCSMNYNYNGGLNSSIISSLINNELESDRNTFHFRIKADVKQYNNLRIHKNKLDIHSKNKEMI